jgi:CRP-like cAMP-binding protein
MEIARLKASPLFAGVDDADLAKLASVASEASVEAGTTVVRSGDMGFTVFVVEEGSADVLKDGRKVAELTAGDIFGEIAVQQSGRRTADVVATTSMRLITIMNRDLWKVQDQLPAIAESIRATMAERSLSNKLIADTELGNPPGA